MDEQGFRKFLKRGGRSQSALDRCVVCVKEFEQYLQAHREGKGLDEAGLDDLEDFVAWIEQRPKTSAKTHLWAIRYYYDYTSNEDLRNLERLKARWPRWGTAQLLHKALAMAADVVASERTQHTAPASQFEREVQALYGPQV